MGLFIVLFLISLVGLFVGLIKPSVFARFLGVGVTRKKVGLLFGGATLVLFVLIGVTAPKSTTSPQESSEAPKTVTTPHKSSEPQKQEAASQPTGISKPKEVSELGKEVFLRLPNNTDPTQIIPLSPTEEVSEKVRKTFRAKDTQGLLELMLNEGVFAVPNGTKALLIDKAFALRKVRILQGEMQGKAGWLEMEFVVNQ